MKRLWVKGIHSEFYDSVQQRRIVAKLKPVRGSEDCGIDLSLRARLRIDWLLHGQIVLNEYQFFDGPMFQRLTPSFLRDTFPSIEVFPPPIRISSITGCVTGGILALYRDTQAAHYRGFDCSLISDLQEQRRFRDYLVSRGCTDIASTSDILLAMRNAGVNHSNIEEIDTGWKNLAAIELSRPAYIELTKRASLKSYRLGFRYEPPEHAKTYLRTKAAKEFVDELYKERNDRGRALFLIDELHGQESSQAVRQDLRRLSRWYNRCYNRAHAHRLKANGEYIHRMLKPHGESSRLFDDYNRARGDTIGVMALPLDRSLLEAIALAPVEQLQAACLRKRDDLYAWWTKNDVKALGRLIRHLFETIDAGSECSMLHPFAKVTLKAFSFAVGKGKRLHSVGAAVVGEAIAQGMFNAPPAVGTVIGMPVHSFIERINDELEWRSSDARRWTSEIVEFGEDRVDV